MNGAHSDSDQALQSEGEAWVQLENDLNTLWVLLGAYLVFIMQCGFAMLEAGCVRSMNTKNILLKNVLDACVSTLIWWCVGYSFAFGENGIAPNPFIGGTNPFMWNTNDTKESLFFSHWLFQWAFAATAGTIVSGAVAERCQFRAYLIYTVFVTGLIYPVVVHWVWSGEGWLSAFRTEDGENFFDRLDEDSSPLSVVFRKSMGLIDFAGSGVVHMTGGGAALVAAKVIGPRVGRFANGSVKIFTPHSVAISTLGVFILWFGWYGFNPVSTLCMRGCMATASKAAVNTTLSATSGGLAVVFVHTVTGNPADVSPVLNGILAGLVSITGSCAVVEPFAAVLIGFIGGGFYFWSSELLVKLEIDDPLDAAPVHFFCGLWGLLAAGFFATPKNLMETYGRSTDVGVFYGGTGVQLGVQIVGILAISLWTMVLSYILFSVMMFWGILRVPKSDEIRGLDISQHGGRAYGLDDPVHYVSPRC